MASGPGDVYRDVAEAAWRWVLQQVRWDEGPWLPASVTDPVPTEPGWDRGGEEQDLEFATHLADVLVERAVRDGPHAYWRFLEHHAPEPLLPPGTGWMQGAAGIAGYLFHVSRVPQHRAGAQPVPRMDNWWALGAADSGTADAPDVASAR